MREDWWERIISTVILAFGKKGFITGNPNI
jgi:hypothetical protein